MTHDGSPALGSTDQFSRGECAALSFVPIVSLETREARIQALRCVQSLEGAAAGDQERGSGRPSTVPWNAFTLPQALQTLSLLSFDLDFLLNVGPGPLDTSDVIRALAAPPLPHPLRLSRVILEIPAAHDGLPPAVIGTLGDLRESCMRLSLLGDPNVCSHAALLRLRPDYLTLPAPLIGGLASDADLQMVVESIAQLAWRLGTQVIAEGARTVEDVETLRGMGISLASGALFRGPLAIEDLVDWRPRIVTALEA